MICGIGQFNPNRVRVDIRQPRPSPCPRMPCAQLLIDQRMDHARLGDKPMRRYFVLWVAEALKGISTTGHRRVMQHDQAGTRAPAPRVEIGRGGQAGLLGNGAEGAGVPSTGKAIAIRVQSQTVTVRPTCGQERLLCAVFRVIGRTGSLRVLEPKR